MLSKKIQSTNITMAPEDKTKHCFRATGRSRTQEVITRENKIIKDNKKDVKNIVKTSKEAFEEMAKASADTATRLEEQIAIIGSTISESNKEVAQSNRETQSSISKLAETLQALLAPIANRHQPAIWPQNDQQPPRTTEDDEPESEVITEETEDVEVEDADKHDEQQDHQPKMNSQNWHDFVVDENKGLIYRPAILHEPSNQGEHNSQHQQELDPPTNMKQASLNNMGTSQTTQSSWKLTPTQQQMNTQHNESLQPRQRTIQPTSSQMTNLDIIQQQDLRIKMLEDRIKLIEDEIDNMKRKQEQTDEDNEHQRAETARQAGAMIVKPKLKKQPILLQPPAIDLDGNVEELNDNTAAARMEHQHLDWAEVKLPKRRWEKRPTMSDTMDQHVKQDLIQHMEEKYNKENCPKTRAQKTMSEEQRQEIIDNMLDRAGYKLGIAPITTQHIDRVNKILQDKGIYPPDDTPQMKKKKTIKALTKSWTQKNFKMSEEEWNSIQIQDIILTDNSDILFLQFKTKSDVSKFTTKAPLLPQNMGTDSPRLIMYVDRRGAKRHKALVNIAKTLRNHSGNTIQTTLRTGKHDFHLRTRTKGDLTPWSEIPPLRITQNIPNFEVGTYQDIINPDNNTPDDNMEQQLDDIEDLEMIIKEVSNMTVDKENLEEQNENKRDRSDNNTSQGKRKTKKSNQTTISSSGTSGSSSSEASGEDSEDEKAPKKILNSTPITKPNNVQRKHPKTLDTQLKNKPEIEHYFSTPQPTNLKLQPTGITRQPSITEVTEPTESLDNQPSKPATRHTKHDNTTQDDDIIRELISTKKTTINHNG